VHGSSGVEVLVAAVDPREVGRRRQRLLGSVRGSEPGPTVVCCAALHGDEPSGILALGRVFDELERRRPPLRGEVVGVAGNLTALVEGRRFIAADLNRHWLAGNLERARAAAPGELTHEDRELRELLDTLHELFTRARGAVYFLDLHTSSAAGDPFVCVGDTLRNRAFAEQFRVPVILGLEECIDGSLLEYVNDLGHVTVGVEAGQHRADSSVDRHVSFVWLALVAAGAVSPAEVPDLEGHRRRLSDASRQLHGFLEVRHRHPIVAADEFAMLQGFSNFQSVAAGDLLAHDRSGEIRAPESGRILLPLYQGLGSDGYFIAREVRSFWLRVSSGLRRLGLDSLLHWLPGVRRHPDREATLIIDTGLARWLALEVFHLLGYRKRRSEGGKLVVSRRRFDHNLPAGGGHAPR